DADRKDYLWVSGVWRVPPEGRQWVPGHWQQSDDGWQWVPGFWAAADQTELQYLPPPPDSLEQGPSAPRPGDNYIYQPGCWIYRDDRYAWQPGDWVEDRPDACWVPNHYVWCPSGYLFVSGYWDYPLADRGLLFAPCYFQQPVYQQPDFCWTPSCVVS